MKKKNKGIVEVFELDGRDYLRIELFNDYANWFMFSDECKLNNLSQEKQNELEKMYELIN